MTLGNYAEPCRPRSRLIHVVDIGAIPLLYHVRNDAECRVD